jgi:hypothetical protein
MLCFNYARFDCAMRAPRGAVANKGAPCGGFEGFSSVCAKESRTLCM